MFFSQTTKAAAPCSGFFLLDFFFSPPPPLPSKYAEFVKKYNSYVQFPSNCDVEKFKPKRKTKRPISPFVLFLCHVLFIIMS